MRFFLIGVVLILCGCSPEKKHSYIKNEFPSVTKFYSVFPGAVSKIGWFSGIGSPKSWISKAIVYDRYLIRLNLHYEDGVFENPVQDGASVIVIEEINENVLLTTDGSLKSFSGTRLGSMPEEKFLEIESIDEIFKFIGNRPNKDTPIMNIQLLLNYWD